MGRLRWRTIGKCSRHTTYGKFAFENCRSSAQHFYKEYNERVRSSGVLWAFSNRLFGHDRKCWQNVLHQIRNTTHYIYTTIPFSYSIKITSSIQLYVIYRRQRHFNQYIVFVLEQHNSSNHLVHRGSDDISIDKLIGLAGQAFKCLAHKDSKELRVAGQMFDACQHLKELM